MMAEITKKACDWLYEHRCQHCKKRNGHPLKCCRKVSVTWYGWRCHGFKTKYEGWR